MLNIFQEVDCHRYFYGAILYQLLAEALPLCEDLLTLVVSMYLFAIFESPAASLNIYKISLVHPDNTSSYKKS